MRYGTSVRTLLASAQVGDVPIVWSAERHMYESGNEVRDAANGADIWTWFKYTPCLACLLKFGKDGRRLKNRRMRKGSIQNDDVVTDLASAHSDVADSSLDIALGTIKEGKSDLFRKLLTEIHNYCKNKHKEKL